MKLASANCSCDSISGQCSLQEMAGEVADMGTPIADGGMLEVKNCKKWCHSFGTCESLNVCEEGGPGPWCYLFDKKLSGSEPTNTTTRCTTYYKSCSSGNFS